MQLKISLKQLNKNYSEELTRKLQHDPESIANPKYQLEVSMKKFVEVDKLIIDEDQDLTVEIVNSNDQMGSISLKNMTIFRGLKDEEIKVEFAVSKDLITRTSSPPKGNLKNYFYIYLRDVEDLEMISRKVYFTKSNVITNDSNI